jgi:hypothetical protein
MTDVITKRMAERMAEAILDNIDWDEGLAECRYCHHLLARHGDSRSDAEHEPDCIVLVARDLMEGE